MTDNNTWMMNLNSPIYSTLLPNKFLIWGSILCIWDFGRSRDQNAGSLQIWLYKIIGGTLLMCQNTAMREMEHGLKYSTFYVQKHITPCTVVITSLLVRDKPLGVPACVNRVYSQLELSPTNSLAKTSNIMHTTSLTSSQTSFQNESLL